MRAPFKARSKCEARIRLRLLLSREGATGLVRGRGVGRAQSQVKSMFLRPLRSFRGKAQAEEQSTYLAVPSCERE